jgi:Tol biopolymer transport system component
LVLGVILSALAVSCGNGDNPPPPPATGPSDVIAFGARDGDGEWALYLTKPDGSGRQSLVQEAGQIDFPLWSSGAARIAYLVRSGASGPATLRVYSFDGGPVTISDSALFDPLGPTMSWSPDGQRLAFINSAGELSMYDFEHPALVSLPSIEARGVDWDPSGGRLAVVTGDPAADTDISLVSESGSDLESLVERPGPEGEPRWSPNGELLSFWSASSGPIQDYQLFVVSSNGGEPVDLAEGFGAAWRPDGELLAYSAPAGPGAPADLDIFTIDAGGGDPEPLSQSPTRDRWPSWSPDGSALVYHAQADAQTAYVCIIRLELESRDCLDLGELLPTAAVWSPR